jgi:hypothetical protein
MGLQNVKNPKKWKGVPPSSIINFLGGGTSYCKNNGVQIKFIEDLVLYACKGYETIWTIESSWLRRLVMKRFKG